MDDVGASPDPGWIGLRADKNEIVVHHGRTADPGSLRDELLFCGLGMNEHDVGVAPACGIQRLAGALGDDADVDPRLGAEDRKQVIEEARILGGGRRSDGDEPRAGTSSPLL
jgi:hypothetical protein